MTAAERAMTAPLTALERAHLKRLRHEHVMKATAFTGRSCCAECGGHFDDTTPGCGRCRDRHRCRAKEAA